MKLIVVRALIVRKGWEFLKFRRFYWFCEKKQILGQIGRLLGCDNAERRSADPLAKGSASEPRWGLCRRHPLYVHVPRSLRGLLQTLGLELPVLLMAGLLDLVGKKRKGKVFI